MANPDIRRATEALEHLSQDPKARELARWREDQLRLYRMELATAEQRGRQEGRQEGLRAAVRALCDVLEVELSASREAALDTLSAADLEELLETLRRQRHWPEH
ncbi:MAG: hypothetical protein JW940_21905 [Polyangiaceae bacterium]|nr:hypothetical protein [Polyangiaceae bacterium]